METGKRRIVVAHNDLVEMPLRGFSKRERIMFMAICLEVKNKGTNKVKINITELKRLTKMTNMATGEFSKQLLAMNDKLMKLSLTTFDGRWIKQFVLFPEFTYDVVENSLQVKVSDTFAYMLNKLKSNFSKLTMEELASLRTKYSAATYQLLKVYRTSGERIISIEDFRAFLDIPDCYEMRDINKRILLPVVEELQNYFEDLQVEKIYSQEPNKRVSALRFTFVPDKVMTEEEKEQYEYAKEQGYIADNGERVAEITTWEDIWNSR